MNQTSDNHRKGKLLYYFTWPAAYIYLYFSKRARVLVVVDDEVLVVKGWQSGFKWVLPGGGLKIDERPENGAIRELKEETGIVATPGQLELLFARRVKNRSHQRFFAYVYVLRLRRKPALTLHSKEISDAEWISWKKLKSSKDSDKTLNYILDVWQGNQ